MFKIGVSFSVFVIYCYWEVLVFSANLLGQILVQTWGVVNAHVDYYVDSQSYIENFSMRRTFQKTMFKANL